MAIDNFIPEVWSANLLQAKDKVHVVAGIATREYEGEIREFGDRVKVSQIGEITVGTYTKDSTTISFQNLQDAQSELIVDQSNYIAFEIDDVDKAQTRPKVMMEAMRKSGYALADTQDSYLLGLYANSGLSQNTDASPADVTSLNVDEEILAVGEKLDEANAPRQNRFMIIPPWFHTKIVLAGLTTKTANDMLFANGFIDMVLGFKMYLSNNVSIGTPATGAQTRIVAGVENESFAVAEQIVSMEALRRENSFHDAVKGLHLWAGKIWRPDVTCTLYADKTAEA